MFTGIIQQMGRVESFAPNEFGATLVIAPSGWAHQPRAGDSVAINGCCLTVTNPVAGQPADRLRFDVIRQTLDLTTLGGLLVGDPVNLEHAMRADSMLDGHIVQGHVDGVADVIDVRKSDAEWRTRVRMPDHLMEYIVPQGSVALDGVSLTIAACGDDWCEVALIPTTLQITTLGVREVGSRMNVETDCIAKTVVHWLRNQQAHLVKG
jgi:riboflavin synthase